MHINVLQESTETDSNIDITVTGDGTWKIRGHKSLIGACVVGGAIPGKVIDTQVMLTYCKGCECYKVSKSSFRFQKWPNSALRSLKYHKESSVELQAEICLLKNNTMMQVRERISNIYNKK